MPVVPTKRHGAFPPVDLHWMRQAIAVACDVGQPPLATQDVPVGALLIYQNECIAVSANRREREQNPIGHAEMLVLQAAAAHLNRWRLDGASLYVTLEPCPMCASALKQARVSQVVFGAYDPLLGACGSYLPLLMDSPDVQVVGGILEAECRALLQTFFKRLR